MATSASRTTSRSPRQVTERLTRRLGLLPRDFDHAPPAALSPEKSRDLVHAIAQNL
ncbi:hypothetical protein [Streptomyces swartbergensis]|uniref:hypothetical protein n=1 Tax=Streptomyces swartbergensis TaxID=487165 RepID=UPI0037FDCA80